MLTGVATVQCFENSSPAGTYSHYCCGFDNLGSSYSAWWPHVALFCPYCGELWGRRVYLYNFDYQPYRAVPWNIETEACAAHGGGQLIPTNYESDADEQLIKREFTLLMQQTERS